MYNCLCANLFSRLLVEVFLSVDITECHAEVCIGVSSASLPARCLLLQSEDLLRELKAEIPKFLQSQGSNGRIHAPPDVSD